jgi:hypothetical protein
MDEICIFIKSVCDIPNPIECDGCEYIEFSAKEDNDWSNGELANYVSSELQTHLGADVGNIQDTIIDDRVIVNFTYNGFKGEIWETYNSRGYHYWVVSI